MASSGPAVIGRVLERHIALAWMSCLVGHSDLQNETIVGLSHSIGDLAHCTNESAPAGSCWDGQARLPGSTLSGRG